MVRTLPPKLLDGNWMSRGYHPVVPKLQSRVLAVGRMQRMLSRNSTSPAEISSSGFAKLCVGQLHSCLPWQDSSNGLFDFEELEALEKTAGWPLPQCVFAAGWTVISENVLRDYLTCALQYCTVKFLQCMLFMAACV